MYFVEIILLLCTSTLQGAEYAAFIYNVNHGLQLISASLLSIYSNNNSKTDKSFTRKPYIGYFKVLFSFVSSNSVCYFDHTYDLCKVDYKEL